MKKPSPPSKITLVAATLLSGLLWYFAIDISGRFGFLVWVAPLPILWISLQTSGRISFLCAWLAYLLGRLSWVPFLMVLMPVVPTILVTLLPPFIFGFSILLNRWIVLKSQRAWSVLAFPAIAASFEFLIFNNPVDGTAGSLSYTQSNYVTIIQLASVTGIWGIVFVASLFSAAVVMAWHFRENRSKQISVIAMAGTLLLSAGVFGIVRVNQTKPHSEVTVGITAVSESLYGKMSDIANFESARNQIVNQYIEQISSLAKKEARYILFPEKVLQLTKSQKDSLLAVFANSATQLNATIIGGVATKEDNTWRNLVQFVPPAGAAQQYQKRFHVKGFEGHFERGTRVGLLTNIPFSGGMAICKDMDFPTWLREYQQVDLLFVPAWDFVQDGWLHSRMAIIRGVENGYTIVRAGRQGRLTVSDYRGIVVAEANVENGKAASLLAKAPIYHVDTIYSNWGDWFGWFCIFITAFFIVRAFVISRRKNQVN
jgi:apolipoprotein N-acyltransferase